MPGLSSVPSSPFWVFPPCLLSPFGCLGCPSGCPRLDPPTCITPWPVNDATFALIGFVGPPSWCDSGGVLAPLLSFLLTLPLVGSCDLLDPPWCLVIFVVLVPFWCVVLVPPCSFVGFPFDSSFLLASVCVVSSLTFQSYNLYPGRWVESSGGILDLWVVSVCSCVLWPSYLISVTLCVVLTCPSYKLLFGGCSACFVLVVLLVVWVCLWWTLVVSWVLWWCDYILGGD